MLKSISSVDKYLPKHSSPADILVFVIFIYALICAATAAFFNTSSPGQTISKSVQIPGGTVGPLKIEKDNTVYDITLQQNVSISGDWSGLDVEVLNEKKQTLFGFSDELWAESGYDSDGSWYENKTRFHMKITFKKAGIYYLAISNEMNKNSRAGKSIHVEAKPKNGSAMFHYYLAIISMIATIIIFQFSSYKQKSKV